MDERSAPDFRAERNREQGTSDIRLARGQPGLAGFRVRAPTIRDREHDGNEGDRRREDRHDADL
jgi:hypothetical protein